MSAKQQPAKKRKPANSKNTKRLRATVKDSPAQKITDIATAPTDAALTTTPTNDKPIKIPKKKGGPQPGSGRKRKNIDWIKIDRMCKILCTHEEIASILGTSTSRLEERCIQEHGIGFSEYYDRRANGGKMSLRRRQFSAALAGNSTMLIWLGKQCLAQSDKSQVSGMDGAALFGGINIIVVPTNPAPCSLAGEAIEVQAIQGQGPNNLLTGGTSDDNGADG